MDCATHPLNRGIKEPTHSLKGVGNGVPGVVVWRCCGRISSGMLPIHFDSVEMNKVDMNLWIYESKQVGPEKH